MGEERSSNGFFLTSPIHPLNDKGRTTETEDTLEKMCGGRGFGLLSGHRFFFYLGRGFGLLSRGAFCKLRAGFVLSRKGLLPVYVSIDVYVYIYIYIYIYIHINIH